MIIFLYGKNSYQINEKLSELIDKHRIKNPSGLNFISLDFLESPLKDYEDNVINSSLLPEKKLIILKNIEKTDTEKLLELITSQNLVKRDDIISVFVSFSDSKSKLSEYLIKKPNQSQNFKLLNSYEAKDWAKKLLNSLDIEITGEALDFLLSCCGSDEWRLESEIKKIACFKIKGLVGKPQMEELVVISKNHNVFELTNALANKNKNKALEALHKILENNEKPTEVLGMLAWQMRNILQFKLNPHSLKIHPFVLGKLKESAKFFSIDELKKISLKIIDLDLAFKTKDVNEKTALSLLIAEL